MRSYCWKRLGLLFVSGALCIGCATPESEPYPTISGERIHIDTLITRYGQPSRILELNDGKKVYIWSSLRVANTTEGSAEQVSSATIGYQVDRNGLVEHLHIEPYR